MKTTEARIRQLELIAGDALAELDDVLAKDAPRRKFYEHLMRLFDGLDDDRVPTPTRVDGDVKESWAERKAREVMSGKYGEPPYGFTPIAVSPTALVPEQVFYDTLEIGVEALDAIVAWRALSDEQRSEIFDTLSAEQVSTYGDDDAQEYTAARTLLRAITSSAPTVDE